MATTRTYIIIGTIILKKTKQYNKIIVFYYYIYYIIYILYYFIILLYILFILFFLSVFSYQFEERRHCLGTVAVTNKQLLSFATP